VGETGEVARRKAELRERLQAWRRGLSPAEVRRRSAALTRHLLAWPALFGVRAVLAYAALAREPQTAEIVQGLRARGALVALPQVFGAELVPRRAPAGWPVGDGRLVPDLAAEPEVPPETLDAVLVPGLGFDRAGRRLGRGGGHYDRLLARLPRGCLRVGLCFEGQWVDEVPTEPWDQRVDAVVTEVGVWVARAGPA
jgi:5-formyltetrahydrofolate cyclo-ligase